MLSDLAISAGEESQTGRSKGWIGPPGLKNPHTNGDFKGKTKRLKNIPNRDEKMSSNTSSGTPINTLKTKKNAKPISCTKCGATGRPIIGHHPEYRKPDEVYGSVVLVIIKLGLPKTGIGKTNYLFLNFLKEEKMKV
jgi:hypothetical protein